MEIQEVSILRTILLLKMAEESGLRIYRYIKSNRNQKLGNNQKPFGQNLRVK